MEVCCGCIPLKTGVYLIAVLSLIRGALLILRGIVLVHPGLVEKQSTEGFQGFQNQDADITLIRAEVTQYFLDGSYSIVMSLILFKGVVEKRISVLRLWVKISYIVLGISAGIVCLVSIGAIIFVPETGRFLGFAILLSGVLQLAIINYYIGVVKRFTDIIEEEQNVWVEGENL